METELTARRARLTPCVGILAALEASTTCGERHGADPAVDVDTLMKVIEKMTTFRQLSPAQRDCFTQRSEQIGDHART